MPPKHTTDNRGSGPGAVEYLAFGLGILILVSTFGGQAVWADHAQTTLRAGVAKRRVTPPEWVPYLTSSGNGTAAPFQGIHDDLFARALVLDDGKQAMAVIAVDSIGYDNAILGVGRDFTRELRAMVAAKTGLTSAAIMLTASHTHSAPETIGLTPFRTVDGVPAWIESHLQDLAAVTIEAWNNRQPVRAYADKTSVTGIARHRRIALKDGTLNRRGPLPDDSQVAVPWSLDEDLNVVYLETTKGKPHAVLLNYTAHPIVAMTLPPVSADYPGAATAAVEKSLSGAICLFTNGAAGNINSLHVTTNFIDVEATGSRLATAALAEIERLKQESPLADTTISTISESFVLDARSCPPLEEARATADGNPAGAKGKVYRLALKLAEGPIRAEVQAMRMGPVKWVSLPGEPFLETGLALKQAGAWFVVGYANGYVGYLPIRRAYDEGGYETDAGPWSRVAPGSAERLEAIGKRLLAQLDGN